VRYAVLRSKVAVLTAFALAMPRFNATTFGECAQYRKLRSVANPTHADFFAAVARAEPSA